MKRATASNLFNADAVDAAKNAIKQEHVKDAVSKYALSDFQKKKLPSFANALVQIENRITALTLEKEGVVAEIRDLNNKKDTPPIERARIKEIISDLKARANAKEQEIEAQKSQLLQLSNLKKQIEDAAERTENEAFIALEKADHLDNLAHEAFLAFVICEDEAKKEEVAQ